MTWLQQKPKIATPVAETQRIDETIGGPSGAPESTSGPKKGPYGAMALVVLVAAVAGIAYYTKNRPPKGLNVQDLRVERLTRNGKAATVALSRDGEKVAYVLRDGEQSVILRQVATGAETQLTAPEMVSYAGLTFSPDGSSLYYTASSKDNQLYSYLYKIPVQGGQATRLVEDIDTAVSFSPDGKRIAFVRGVPDKREINLVVSNADGSGLKVIARKPGQVYSWSLIAPAWSPDGNTIVFTNYQATNRRYLVAVAPDGSGLHDFYKSHDELGRPQWLPDGSGVLVPVREGNLGERGQLWRVDFPSAKAERVTNDPRDYSVLWLGRNHDATLLASVETTITGDLWILPNGETASERQATTSGALIVYVSSFGKDKILYEARDGRIFTADLDGGNPKQVKLGGQGLHEVSVCGDGKHIVYTETTGETEDIWRVDADGSNPVQLTREKSASSPNCAPDGSWLIYWSDEEHAHYRIPIEGGAPTKTSFPNANSPYLRISPDGKSVIYNVEKQESGKTPYGVIVAPANGGTMTTGFPMVAGMGMTPPQWSPDGRELYFNLMRHGAANIWRMDGPGGAMKQVTDFETGLIASFAWSQDGKTLYVARGTRSTDVVLLKAAK